MFDVNALTLGEVATVEDLGGSPIDTIESGPKGKILAALAYVIQRRTNPDFKFKDALELTFVEANEILGFTDEDSEEEDPKD